MEEPITFLDAYDKVEFSSDLCLKCNICVSVCPVAPVTALFPGPKTVGPQAQRFRHPDAHGEESPDKSVDYCSGCGMCTMACPHSVKVMEMNTRARAKLYNGNIPLRNRILGHSEFVSKSVHYLAPLLNIGAKIYPARVVVEKIIGIHRDAPLPPFSFQTFRSWYARNKPQPKAPIQGKVALFHSCAGNYNQIAVSIAAAKVLAHNGFEIILPEQNCCGLPMQSNGEFDSACAYATRNLDWLGDYARQGIPIVGPSTSCTLSLKSDYRGILQLEHPNRDVVSDNTYDICEFLVELHGAGKLRTDFKPLAIEGGLLYHAPCQQKAHNMGFPALDLLDLIPDLEVRLADATCCGIAGTYGYKVEKYDIAMAVGEPLFQQARATGTHKAVICDSETCRWQITHVTGAPSIHPVEVLALAYGLQDKIAGISENLL